MKCHRARNGFDALLRHWATVPRIARIPALNPCQQKKNGLIGSFALLENWPLENASHSFLVAREWNMDDLIVRQSKTMTMKSSNMNIKKRHFLWKRGIISWLTVWLLYPPVIIFSWDLIDHLDIMNLLTRMDQQILDFDRWENAKVASGQKFRWQEGHFVHFYSRLRQYLSLIASFS